MSEKVNTIATLGAYEEEGWELTDVRRAKTGLNGVVATIQAKRYDSIDDKVTHNIILIVVNNKTQIETMIPIEAWNEICAVKI